MRRADTDSLYGFHKGFIMSLICPFCPIWTGVRLGRMFFSIVRVY